MSKYLKFLLCITVFGCTSPEQSQTIQDIIPSLEEMSSIWINSDTIANQPTLRNFRAQAILNNDLTSISWFASAPYSGAYHSGTMKINGETILAEQFKWSVYGSERAASIAGLNVNSSTRMVFENDGILWKVNFDNPTDTDITISVEQDVIGFISRYANTDWQWWYPTPSVRGNHKELYDEDLIQVFLKNLHEAKKVRDNIGLKRDSIDWPLDQAILNSELYATSLNNQIVSISDTSSDAKTSFAFSQKPDEIIKANSGATAKWQLTIPAKSSKKISFAMAFGNDQQLVDAAASTWANNFDSEFAMVKDLWDAKWHALFTPNNDFVSGNFPVLETTDDRAKRVYYNSPLTMLFLTHTNLPIMDRVVLTGGPRWGPTIMFYWDTTSWRTIGATTDPEMMKENLKGWLTIDINKYYGRDYLNGKGAGNGYVANYWAIFQMLHEYLVVSGDYTFLEEIIEGKSILEHMHEMAYNWKNLSKQGQEGYEGDLYDLADFGDNPWLLLEAVPTYIHIVPSFNAGYVGMLKRLSVMYEKLGDSEMASEVKQDAEKMAKLVLQLYRGDGTWNSLFPDHKKVEIRHSLDFHFIGRYMADDLSEEMKEEMVTFVEKELLTDTWMRAQSQTDPAAKDSDRPDHGPLGAYDGWPLNTMEAMYHMGYPEKAMDFYRNIYPVTLEGNWAQAHELWGDNKDNKGSRVRIAERGWHVRDAASGIGFANVMLREFFGFMPKFMDDNPLDQPEMARSIRGKMHHVAYKGKYYTIISNEDGLSMKEEVAH